MKREKTLETILTISGGLLVLYLYLKLKWLLYVAVAIVVIGLFVQPLARIIAMGWMKLAEGMGFVMSKVILTLVFFVILTPVALLQKVFKKSTIQLKKKEGSMYTTREHKYEPKDFDNPW